MIYLLLIVAALQLPQASESSCGDTHACIEKVRRLATERRRFWFGEQWKDICSGRYRHPIDCFNPHLLQHFHSIGSRLFRAKTYQAGFLQNLRIFPRVTFRVRPGTYRACDHNFGLTDEPYSRIIEADPTMEPVEPYKTRYLPDIRWNEMNNNSTFVVMITDIGFATLNYLASGFPIRTEVLVHYWPSENFRHLANPVAVIIFEEDKNFKSRTKKLKLQSGSELFDLPKFMLDNALENALIGLNIYYVSTDAYAIEKQRLRGVIDNCHSLLERKLRAESRWKFVESFPLSEMDSWLSVSYQQPAVSAVICCESIQLKAMSLALDPLGDGKLPSLVVHNEPRVSSMKFPQNNENYQRSARDFIGVVLFEHNYSIVLFNPDTSMLYWMVIDVPSSSLAAGNIADGNTVATYLAPIPSSPRSCSTLVFMLFVQPRSNSESAISMFYNAEHPLRLARCQHNCSHRAFFDIEQFKSLHQLRLSAVNWMTVCYDIHEASRQISMLSFNKTDEDFEEMDVLQPHRTVLKHNTEYSERERYTINKQTADKKRRTILNPAAQICIKMGLSTENTCQMSQNASILKLGHTLPLAYTVLLILHYWRFI